MNERRKSAIASAAFLVMMLVYVSLLAQRWRAFDVSIRRFFDMPLGQGLSVAVFTFAILFLGGMAMLFGAWATEDGQDKH